MMAAFGAVVQHFITFPGFDSVPRGIGALFSVQGFLGMAALTYAASILETKVWKQEDGKEIGDFGDPLKLGTLGFGEYNEETRNKEINNGRFAMIAIMGILVAENETGLDAVEQIFGV